MLYFGRSFESLSDGAATTAARGAAAEAAMNADEGTGEDDAAWAAGEGDGLGGREGA